jgi:hypothetical protein
MLSAHAGTPVTNKAIKAIWRANELPTTRIMDGLLNVNISRKISRIVTNGIPAGNC